MLENNGHNGVQQPEQNYGLFLTMGLLWKRLRFSELLILMLYEINVTLLKDTYRYLCDYFIIIANFKL